VKRFGGITLHEKNTEAHGICFSMWNRKKSWNSARRIGQNMLLAVDGCRSAIAWNPDVQAGGHHIFRLAIRTQIRPGVDAAFAKYKNIRRETISWMGLARTSAADYRS